MILENVYTEELVEIFDSNSENYIYDRNASRRNFLNIVYVEDDTPLGYAVIYSGLDFCEQEELPIKLDNIKENSVYIWHMVTKKGYEGKGIGSSLIKYITEKFYDFDIYSIVDKKNKRSMGIHLNHGFIPMIEVKKKDKEKNVNYCLLKHEGK